MEKGNLFDNSLEIQRGGESKKERRQLSVTIRSHAINLLESHGQNNPSSYGVDERPFVFRDSVILEKERLQFSLESSDEDPKNASGISVTLLALNETLLLEEGKIGSVEQTGKKGHEKKEAPIKKLIEYAGLLMLIESQFTAIEAETNPLSS